MRCFSYPVPLLCQMLAIFRSGYYTWRQRPPSRRALEDTRLEVEIKAAHPKCFIGKSSLFPSLKIILIKIIRFSKYHDEPKGEIMTPDINVAKALFNVRCNIHYHSHYHPSNVGIARRMNSSNNGTVKAISP